MVTLNDTDMMAVFEKMNRREAAWAKFQIAVDYSDNAVTLLDDAGMDYETGTVPVVATLPPFLYSILTDHLADDFATPGPMEVAQVRAEMGLER